MEHSSLGSPYQLLVDHLAAAASESTGVVAANMTQFECPAKMADYTCPKLISLSKEELKAKICDYESIITGKLNLVKDKDTAQTNCGGFRLEKQVAKCNEDITELPEQIAVVFGKGCQLEPIVDASSKNETVHLLIKNTIPSGSKFMLLDGANMDLIDSKIVAQDEIAKLLEQCPKPTGEGQAKTHETGKEGQQNVNTPIPGARQ